MLPMSHQLGDVGRAKSRKGKGGEWPNSEECCID